MFSFVNVPPDVFRNTGSILRVFRNTGFRYTGFRYTGLQWLAIYGLAVYGLAICKLQNTGLLPVVALEGSGQHRPPRSAMAGGRVAGWRMVGGGVAGGGVAN